MNEQDKHKILAALTTISRTPDGIGYGRSGVVSVNVMAAFARDLLPLFSAPPTSKEFADCLAGLQRVAETAHELTAASQLNIPQTK